VNRSTSGVEAEARRASSVLSAYPWCRKGAGVGPGDPDRAVSECQWHRGRRTSGSRRRRQHDTTSLSGSDQGQAAGGHPVEQDRVDQKNTGSGNGSEQPGPSAALHAVSLPSHRSAVRPAPTGPGAVEEVVVGPFAESGRALLVSPEGQAGSGSGGYVSARTTVPCAAMPRRSVGPAARAEVRTSTADAPRNPVDSRGSTRAVSSRRWGSPRRTRASDTVARADGGDDLSPGPDGGGLPLVLLPPFCS